MLELRKDSGYQHLTLADLKVGLQSNRLTVCSSYNFFDWFCTEKSLERRAVSLISSLASFIKKGVFDVEGKNIEVLFKNNCPLNGRLYDDFRLVDISSGQVVFGYCKKSGHVNRPVSSFWYKSNLALSRKLLETIETLPTGSLTIEEEHGYVLVEAEDAKLLGSVMVSLKDQINSFLGGK